MAIKLLTDFDDVVLGLGGIRNICALTKRSPQSVCNWRARGNFPAVLANLIRTELRRRGYDAVPPNYCGRKHAMRLDPHGNGQEHKRWPVGRTETLRELWPLKSASLIGKILGITRNAVISKANRLHLPTKKQPAQRKPMERRFVAIPLPPPPTPAPIPMHAPASRNLTIYELGEGQCHFPYGDVPPYRFCGQFVQDGSPYCPYHFKLTHHMPSARRDQYDDYAKWRGVR